MKPTIENPEQKAYRFHQIKFGLWAAQVPVAVLTPLRNSVAYLVFLSIAALVESSGTDVYDDWKERRRQ